MSYVIAVADQKGLAVNGRTTVAAGATPMRLLSVVMSVSARTLSFEGIIGS